MIGAILFSLFLTSVQAESSTYGYKIVSRRAFDGTRRHLEASPQLISYDGDIDRIKALALARSKIINNPSGGSNTTTSRPPIVVTPGNSVLETFECKNATVGHLEILSFKYSIETTQVANVTKVIGEVEEILGEEIAPLLLECWPNTNEFDDIVAIDSHVPADTIYREETCAPVLESSNTCTVVDGRVRLFLTKSDRSAEAIKLSLQAVEKAMGDKNFVNKVETGLRRIVFKKEVGSSVEGTPSTTDSSNNSNEELSNSETGLSAASSAMVGLGSALIIAFVGAAIYMKSVRNKADNDQYVQEAGSSIVSGPVRTFEDDADRPTSPFSEMLPGAYRIGDLDKMSMLSNSNMSPVYEDDDASRSVVVSESGYTTEAAGTDGGDDSSFAQTVPYTPEGEYSTLENLGARPRDGIITTSDLEMSDTDSEHASDGSSQSSPTKIYTTSLLLPRGSLDESMHGEEEADILLFDSSRYEPPNLPETSASMVDISLSEP